MRSSVTTVMAAASAAAIVGATPAGRRRRAKSHLPVRASVPTSRTAPAPIQQARVDIAEEKRNRRALRRLLVGT